MRLFQVMPSMDLGRLYIKPLMSLACFSSAFEKNLVMESLILTQR